ncbi:MAG: mycofactocin biosynthesis glycosyltransferase MftF [Streptosporangiaceae bacterium]
MGSAASPPPSPACSPDAVVANPREPKPGGPGGRRPRGSQTTADLPSDLRLTLGPSVRRADGGRVLIGGSPLRVLKLTDAGRALVDAWSGGAPLGPRPGAQRLARRLLSTGIAQPCPVTSPFCPSEVSVVVPVRDRPAGLERTLAALDDVARTVVVDDGSSPPVGTASVRHPRARGPAAARNAGWRRTSTPLVAFVDADCVPEPGWLDPLLPHFADPRVAAVAPRVVCPTAPGVLARYESVRSPLDLGPTAGIVRPGARVAYVPSAALVVRREALEACGGFDEALRVGEDVDLVWRLAGSGWAVRYEPRGTVAHPPRGSLPALARQRARYGTSAAPLASRHEGALAPLAVSVWSAAAWTLAGLGRPDAGLAVAGATAALLPRRLRGLLSSPREPLRIAALGHLFAGRQVADAVVRAWWPLAATSMAWPRARPAVAACATVPYLAEWVRRRPPVDPVRWTALRLLDDLAYGAGLWAGCVRERTRAPLVPDLKSWPGRGGAVDMDPLSPGRAGRRPPARSARPCRRG